MSNFTVDEAAGDDAGDVEPMCGRGVTKHTHQTDVSAAINDGNVSHG